MNRWALGVVLLTVTVFACGKPDNTQASPSDASHPSKGDNNYIGDPGAPSDPNQPPGGDGFRPGDPSPSGDSGSPADPSSPADSYQAADPLPSGDLAPAPALVAVWYNKFVGFDELVDLSAPAYTPSFGCTSAGVPFSLRLNATSNTTGIEFGAGNCVPSQIHAFPLPAHDLLEATNTVRLYDQNTGSVAIEFIFRHQKFEHVIETANSSVLWPYVSQTHIVWTGADGGPYDIYSYRLADAVVTNHTNGAYNTCYSELGLGTNWVFFGINAICTTFLDYFRLDLDTNTTEMFISKTNVAFGGNEQLHAAGQYVYTSKWQTYPTEYGIYRVQTSGALNSGTLLDVVTFANPGYINHLQDSDGVHSVTIGPATGADDDVILSRFSDGQTTVLNNDARDQIRARVSGDYVVWTELQGSDAKLFLYQISNQQVAEVSSPEHPLDSVNASLDVDGDYIVYKTGISGPIFVAYKISTQEYFTLYGFLPTVADMGFLSAGRVVYAVLPMGETYYRVVSVLLP